MEDLNKYRKILYKKWRRNTILDEDTPVKEVMIEAACGYYLIMIPKTHDKEKDNWYKKVDRERIYYAVKLILKHTRKQGRPRKLIDSSQGIK